MPYLARPLAALLCCALVLGAVRPTWATPSGPGAEATAALCAAAGRRAAQASGVPYDVLRAISLTETGRRVNGRHQPWPWTVNMEGKGRWFDSRQEAYSYVKRHFDRGARSFDVGCFQINYRWHGSAFRSLEEMFDPDQSARYAARFLAALYRERRSWSWAAGAYHSRTPKYAKRYRARFDRILAKLTGSSDAPLPALAEPGVIPAAPGGGSPEADRWALAQRAPGAPGDRAQAPGPVAPPQTPPSAPPLGPEHWVPPPPTPLGSVAAVGVARRAPGLWRTAPGSLY